MKELIRVRVQYALRQQCCKTHKRPLPFFTGISEQPIGPNFKGRAVEFFLEDDTDRLTRNISDAMYAA